MINSEEIRQDENNNAKFIYNINNSGGVFNQIHTVLDVSNPNRPKAIKSFVDEYVARDYADEYYLKEDCDCLIVSSSLNVSVDETNY